jgi:methylmalonyl-CoA mutase cobalamin-binding domain/chain
MVELIKLKDAIVAGKLEDAIAVTKDAIDEKVDMQMVISDYMIKAMEEIGQRFQDGQAYVPELLMAARAMKGALELIKPLLVGGKAATIGKVVIGTVYGDLHDIGKNLVASMFEGCGFEVVNLGVNVSADQFIEAVKREKPDILCLSALLTTTMNYMKTVIEAMEKENLRQHVKIMVGGAPLNEMFAEQIGADGYTDNANTAVAFAKHLVEKSNC